MSSHTIRSARPQNEQRRIKKGETGYKQNQNQCKRCGDTMYHGWENNHYMHCPVVLAAKQFQRDMRKTYHYVDTPPLFRVQGPCDESVHDCASHNANEGFPMGHESPEEPEEQNACTSEMTQQLATVTAHLDSLPALDPNHVMGCMNWGPKPQKISYRTRKTIQFLSCTCMEDGMSRMHMRAILKYIKGLRGPDTALLPASVEGCWNIMETVRITNHTPPKMSCISSLTEL
jgi:hypothetical protein